MDLAGVNTSVNRFVEVYVNRHIVVGPKYAEKQVIL